jgi:hypothetical protein
MMTKRPLTELSSVAANWRQSNLYYKGTQGNRSMTDQERITMIEDQCEHVIALCETYVEGDLLEDVGNIRALYEEYGEWLDTYNGVAKSSETYDIAWCPNLMECDQ